MNVEKIYNSLMKAVANRLLRGFIKDKSCSDLENEAIKVKCDDVKFIIFLDKAEYYGLDQDELMCYDTEHNALILFVSKQNEITEDEIATILLNRKEYEKRLNDLLKNVEVLDNSCNGLATYNLRDYCDCIKRPSLREMVSEFIDENFCSVFFCCTPELKLKKQLTESKFKHGDVFYFFHEAYNSDDLRAERQIASNIYDSIANCILSSMSQSEKDVYDIFKALGNEVYSIKSLPLNKQSKLSHVLNQANNIFVIDTPYGKLNVGFVGRDEYNTSKSTLMGYDTELNKIVIFVDNPEKVTIGEIITLLRNKYRFIHELTHYIDAMTTGLNGIEHDDTNEGKLRYLNDKDEVKANLQASICAFGNWLFRNHREIQEKRKDLTQPRVIMDLYVNYFLRDKLEPVVDDKTLQIFNTQCSNLNVENKRDFIDQIFKCLVKDHKDGTFTEETYIDYYTRLLRLNETL